MVVATTPAALISAPLPKVTPFGLTKITWPFALIAPSIIDCVAPVTRFNVTAFEFGWLKFTVAFLPTLKLSQLMTARCEVWFTFMVAEVAVCDCEIDAFPATTWPFVGSANFGKLGTAGLANTAVDVRIKIEKKACEIFPANLAFTKKFFNDVFNESSELSLRLFFTTDSGFFRKTVFSQALMFISISCRDNVLEALKLQALFCPKNH